MDVCVIGAGGHGRCVVSVLQACGHQVTMVLDDTRGLWGQSIDGAPVRGPIEEYSHLTQPGVMAIGDNAARKAIAGTLSFAWATVVHPFSWVDPSVTLGPGTVVMPGAVVQVGSKVGAHVIINTRASIGHDTEVGDFAHVASAAHLGGHSRLGEGAFMAIGSVARNYVTIGEWTTVGVGAAVVNDVPANRVAVGVPARIQ